MNQIKKASIAIAIAILTALTVLSMVGCNNTASLEQTTKDNFVGTWSIIEFHDGDNDLTEMIDTLTGMGMDMHVEITDDNGIDIIMIYDDSDESLHGTWTIKDENTIHVTINGSSSDVVLDDNKITIEQDNQKMVCVRNSQDFSPTDTE